MKRVLVLTALLLSLSCVGVAAWAEEGPYRYRRLDGAGGAHLVQYLGAESSLVLPEQLGGYPLVGMDRDAFLGAKNLRELTLPMSLQEIQGNPMTAGDFVIRVPQGHSVFTIYNEALYNKALTHLYGHPRTSSKTDSSTGALPNELFAHYFSARIRGSEEELNLFRYFLPEATHVMEDMLPAMLEEAKAILLVSEAE
jgi:hypothetical protein